MDVMVESVRSMSRMREFVSFARHLYAGNRQWVPVFDSDYKAFYKREHPFFLNAEAEFLLATRDRDPVGRVMMISNHRYNAHHGKRAAHFYFMDFIDDEEVTDALFAAMSDWARAHDLDTLMGPLFSGATYGGGVLVEGFEYPAAMTMMPYNYRYYRSHYERAGFSKHFDLLSLRLDPETFELPEKVERLAEHVRRRGRMKVARFETQGELERAAKEVGRLYNPTLANHYENYPLADEELDRVIRDLLRIAQPDLEKVIIYDGEIVGYMLGFPDLTPALQKSHGRLTPLSVLRLMWRARHPRKLILNGMGILDKYQRLGANALVYSEIARTVRDRTAYTFKEAEMVQINEHTDLILADMRRLGAQDHKRHRVYVRQA